MRKRTQMIGFISAVTALGVCCLNCAGPLHRRAVITPTNSRPGIERLVKANPTAFLSPFTMVTVLDRRISGCNMFEAECWSEWFQHVNNRGLGFVFATTTVDSAGVVWAAQLEGIRAPVLVFPKYERFFMEVGFPPGVGPLHFLVDSTASVHGIWASFRDTSRCSQLTSDIDSLITQSSEGT